MHFKLKKVLASGLCLGLWISMLFVYHTDIKAAEDGLNLFEKATTTFTTSANGGVGHTADKIKDGLIEEDSRWDAGYASSDSEYYFITNFDKINTSNTETVKGVAIDWYVKNFDYYLVKRRTDAGWESNATACKVYTDNSKNTEQDGYTVKSGKYHDEIVFKDFKEVKKVSVVVPREAFKSNGINVFGKALNNLNYISMTEYRIYDQNEDFTPLSLDQTALEIDLQEWAVETTAKRVLKVPENTVLNGYQVVGYESSDNRLVNDQGIISTVPKDNVQVGVKIKISDGNRTVLTRVQNVLIKGSSGQDSNAVRQNLASGKGVRVESSSSQESASNAIDGIIDHEHRWESKNNHGIEPLPLESLTIDLGKAKKIEEIELYWAWNNLLKYQIEISEDGKEYNQVYVSNNSKLNTTITLDEQKVARFIRISSDAYGVVNEELEEKTAISLLEVKIFDKKYEPGIVEINNLDEALNFIVAHSTKDQTVLGLEVNTLDFVKFENFKVEICADYEQVIGRDGAIYRPLSDQIVELIYKVTDGENKRESAQIKVLVKGKYGDEGINKKPQVIPEIAQWHGAAGQFVIDEKTQILYQDDKLKDVAIAFQTDFEEMLGTKLEIIKSNQPKPGDFLFKLVDWNPGIGKEGYEANIGDYVDIKACHETGAYYATRTILQILQQTQHSIVRGELRDFPKWQIRGFMMDIARKPFTLENIKQISKAMSWYKLNDFQLHLNDNYAKMEKHLDNPNTTDINEIEAIMDEVYAAFRLESNEEGLTSKDQSYTKEEFGNLIDESKKVGINIVPEFDVPGHSLAFLRQNKDLYYKGKVQGKPSADRIAMFDLTNQDAIKYIKNLFSEYIDDGTFRDSVVHIGADEYYGENSDYRRYTSDLLQYITESKERTARIWGSYSKKTGTDKIYNKDVQMNIWSVQWANPVAMIKQGFNIINTNGPELYIVPGGNYYHDYLHNEYIYNKFEPERFVNEGSSYTVHSIIPSASDQMLGACFALWNDGIDMSSNGVNDYEVNKRILNALPVIAAKMWGHTDASLDSDSKHMDLEFNEFEKLVDQTNNIPGTNLLYEVKSKTEKIVDYQFTKESLNDNSGNGYHINLDQTKNISLTDDYLQLNGETSYLPTGMSDLGPTNHLKINVCRDNTSDNSEQILLESSQGAIKAVQKETGKVGYSRSGYDYSFDYELPKNEWVELAIICDDKSVRLYVNGELIDEKGIMQTITTGKDPYKTNQNIHEVTPTRFEDYPTLVLPLERIGSTAKAFKGKIRELKVYNKSITNIDYQELLSRIENLDKNEYIDDSWQNLQTAIQNNVIDMANNPTQKEIDVACNNIKKALNALIYLVDEAKKEELIKNKEELIKYIESNQYEDESVILMKTIIKNINTLLESNELSTVKIEKMLNEIKLLKDNLVLKKADKSALKIAIDTAEKLDLSLYTPETAQLVNETLADAKIIYQKDLTIREQNIVDKANERLLKAINNLKPNLKETDYHRLEVLVNELKKLDKTRYTKETWESFNDVLEKAEKMLQEKNSTQEEVNQLLRELEKEYSQLVLLDSNINSNSAATGDTSGINSYTIMLLIAGVMLLFYKIGLIKRLTYKK